MSIESYIYIISIIAIIAAFVWFYHKDKVKWNGGKCPECGGWLTFKGLVGCGSRDYRCDKCGHRTTVFFLVDDDF